MKPNKARIQKLRRATGALDEVEVRFGRRLKALRLERKMTQKELAELWHLDRGHYSRLEAGQHIASLQMLEILSLGYSISLSELLRGV